MDWGRVRFFFSEVGRNFSRNVIMQATAIGTVTVMIVLLGTFLFLQATIGAIGNNVINQIEISAFLSDKAQPADARALARQIRKDPRVKSVAYIPKAEGLRQMRERLRGQIDTSLLTSNPLPDALRVRVIDPEQVHAVAASIRKLTGVANVEYAHDAVERLLKVSIVVGQVGWAFIVLLIFTASIIIANTIRLTVFARRREIAIMQLVGASNTYIRLPFIFEGLIDGLAGALFAIGLLAIGRWQLFPKLLAALPFVPLHEAHLDLLAISFQLIAVGAAVGIVASWISVGRYLRA